MFQKIRSRSENIFLNSYDKFICLFFSELQDASLSRVNFFDERKFVVNFLAGHCVAKPDAFGNMKIM